MRRPANVHRQLGFDSGEGVVIERRSGVRKTRGKIALYGEFTQTNYRYGPRKKPYLEEAAQAANDFLELEKARAQETAAVLLELHHHQP